MNTMHPSVRKLPARTSRAIVAATAIPLLLSLAACDENSSLKRAAENKAAEVIGKIARDNLPEDVAGGFHKIPIQVVTIADGVYQAMGIANTHLIATAGGNVLFDTGISIQAAEQRSKLRAVDSGPISHIILSHSHADHVGGTRFWREPQTEIVAHREFAEEQRYLTELQTYLHHRNRTLFPWMPEQPVELELFRYGGIEPTITVAEDDYEFEQGGVRFEVLSTPGAEGADNLCLWLPERKILFTGDTLGPNFPQFPNIFTMRGEKFRKPVEYLQSLDKLLALDAEILVPSHREHVVGREAIRAGLTRIRDAVRYVHDEVVAGMNAGKTVHQLMAEIQLPAELDLSQEHGRVSWAVKSIWEYYATWFHFDSPTELYPVPAREIYADLAAMSGVEALLQRAREQLTQHQPVHALHFLEVALAREPDNAAIIEGQIEAYQVLLQDAVTGSGNNYEKDYLRSLIGQAQARLAELGSAGAAP